ncbi:cell wall hydrolase [Sphingomonas sp. RB3P16]|uniref:cell wall hydrolase n=1 Tax=Parasphingomonas frigoris TaxID=3096163 RepID=UPI002FC79B95
MNARALLGWVKMRRLSKLGAIGLCALVLAGVSAHAALRAIVEQNAKAAHMAPAPSGYELQDHFPGAAYYYAAAPAVSAEPTAMQGATGTIALPDLPLPAGAALLASDGSVRPAAPFSMASASAIDHGRALQCLTTAIYYEAASEPDAGQQAVAQVILNRVRHPAFPATVCGVVYQGSEHAGCQFSFACDGALLRGAPSKAYWLRALKVAVAALNGHVMAEVGLATHYHTYAVTPSWNRSLVMTAAIGAHFFHRWQGGWGTPAAFRQGYVGGEPVPGPHARTDPPVILAAAIATAVVPTTPVPVTKAAAIQPAYVQSGTPVAAPKPAVDTLPGDSQILDRWKDSGKPLR